MRFALVHKTASYLMIAAAFISLAMSQQLSHFMLGITIVGGIASYFFDPKPGNALATKWWANTWNGFTFILFGWSILDCIRGDMLASGSRFLCILLLNKLWNRGTSADYLWAYVVSFLMLLAGAALSTNLWYAVCFLAYVVFSTWSLTLFHLRREMEDNYLLKHQGAGDGAERVGVERILNSRRVVGASFLLATTVVSLGIFFGSALAFFVVPRIGLGFFFQKMRPNASLIGFTERVELGEYGLIKNNPQVVMRVEFDGPPPDHPLRFRGISFDHYEAGHWTRTKLTDPVTLRRTGHSFLPAQVGMPHPLPAAIVARERRALVQHVYLDPLDTSVLFGATQPVSFALPPVSPAAAGSIELEGRAAGEVYAFERRIDPGGRSYRTERKSGIKYTVYSDESQPSNADLLRIVDPVEVPAEVQAYLQLPKNYPTRVIDLAKKITVNATGPFWKAMAIGEYLRSHYQYTLDLKRDARYEPIEDFLFVQKAGHCEYFASTMAVMLRAVGVPARSVNGFAGGEWNQYGNYLAVRHGDAHTWVEVWIAGQGWITFDPTPSPPSTGKPRLTAMDRMRQMMDTLEMTWFKYVIEYDLAKQVDFLSGAKNWATGSSKSKFPRPHASKKWWLLLLVGCVPLAYFLRRRRGAKKRLVDGARGEASEALERALWALQKRGLARKESETGREFSRRVDAAADPSAVPFSELVELYYQARYRHVKIEEIRLHQLADAVTRPPSLPPAAPRP